MAEYYDMQETMNKLRKSEAEVQDLVRQGQLRQYMDAGKAVFKVEDINALAEEILGLDVSSVGLAPDGSEIDLDLGSSGTAGIELEPEVVEETSGIQLEPDTEAPAKGPGPDDLELDLEPDLGGSKESEGGFGLSQMGDLTAADTNVGTIGINILSGTGDAYKLTEDTRAETSAEEVEDLENLDEDVNLESFGSGSGLLDLSLQADDTSLGAVLDDILPAGAEAGEAVGGADLPVEEIGLVEEGEDLLGEAEPAAVGMVAEAVTAPMGAAETAPMIPAAAAQMIAVVPVDPKTTVFGVLMFLPMLALVAAAIVLTAAVQNVVPSMLKTLIGTEVAGFSLIWIIVGGMAVLLLLILAFSAVSGGDGKTKTPKAAKAPKPAKAKKEKAPKVKKEKPAKKKGK